MTVLLTCKIRIGGLNATCDFLDDLRLRIHQHPSGYHQLHGHSFDIDGYGRITEAGIVLGRMSLNWEYPVKPSAAERKQVLTTVTDVINQHLFNPRTRLTAKLDEAAAIAVARTAALDLQCEQLEQVDAAAAELALDQVRNRRSQLQAQRDELEQQIRQLDDQVDQLEDQAAAKNVLVELGKQRAATVATAETISTLKRILTGRGAAAATAAPVPAVAGIGLDSLD